MQTGNNVRAPGGYKKDPNRISGGRNGGSYAQPASYDDQEFDDRDYDDRRDDRSNDRRDDHDKIKSFYCFTTDHSLVIGKNQIDVTAALGCDDLVINQDRIVISLDPDLALVVGSALVHNAHQNKAAAALGYQMRNLVRDEFHRPEGN